MSLDILQNVLNEVIEKAKKVFSDEVIERFPINGIEFSKSKSNRVLGSYYVSQEKIEINKKYFDLCVEHDFDVLKKTIIHEYAHHLTDKLYPNAKQSHGPEFKRIDLLLGGRGTARATLPEVISNGLNANSKRAVFVYKCNCRKHELTSIRHNRALKGVGYRCGACYTKLEFVGE